MLCVIWDSFAAASDFVKSERYATYHQEVERVTAERPRTTHCVVAHPKQALTALFDSPAIEMAPLKLKGDKIFQHYQNFQKAGQMIAATKGNVAQFQEPQVEDT